MLSREEEDFMRYWEANRDKEKRVFRQLLIGLPVGLLFALPILINYLSGWYKRATMVGNAQFNPTVLVVAVIAIAAFFAIFGKKHRWDMNEQKYRELEARQKSD
ncbi:MAG TPA: hypothetical protein VIK74_10345 [Parasegetibacter sp.]|jgi:membrane protein YdbS with pleckstrin-like domain